ncbi:putative dienelactone hydrolase [Saccharothrix tamanrassetensis]|uniref:Putative dienelactone hydrolase n=1 Tax=Saccharothrix tamanrassetensis TaxID=1051531 RepID=A0A841CVF1_9PSEU|nr:alpha/beta hydrolase [Saccharothrix tamanrassetensis]MBB5960118.1 putative dienelactone hydrolase [Saccharothrix tamanrassetensis]
MLRTTAVVTAALLIAGGGVAQAADTVRLPAPTGPHRVGVTTLHLVDRDRLDPWPDAVGRNRELMATVFYPAHDVRSYPVAPQMTPGAAEKFAWLDVNHAHPELPKSGVDWAATRTHSHIGAPALPVRRPVLLYSPGAADPRTVNTALAEDLASRGYVVVSFDHPGETSEVEFPGGRVRIIALPADPRTNPDVFRAMIDTRLADTGFVLDRLEVLARGGNPDADGKALPKHLGRALDLRRIGMYGHSAGGTTAAEGMYEDRRIDAAVNLEGYLDHGTAQPGQPGELLPIARNGVDRPLLLLGTDGYRDARYDSSWAAMLAHGGRTTHREVTDATHWVFTDFAAMAPQFQAAGLMTEADRVKLVGAIAPTRSVPLVRGIVGSFFDRHLRR